MEATLPTQIISLGKLDVWWPSQYNFDMYIHVISHNWSYFLLDFIFRDCHAVPWETIWQTLGKVSWYCIYYFSFAVSLWVWCEYTYVCMGAQPSMFAGTCTYMCMWRLEVDDRCPPLSLSFLYTEASCLTWTRLANSGSYQLALGTLYLLLNVRLACMWVLGIQTLLLTLVHLLRCLSNFCS